MAFGVREAQGWSQHGAAQRWDKGVATELKECSGAQSGSWNSCSTG